MKPVSKGCFVSVVVLNLVGCALGPIAGLFLVYGDAMATFGPKSHVPGDFSSFTVLAWIWSPLAMLAAKLNASALIIPLMVVWALFLGYIGGRIFSIKPTVYPLEPPQDHLTRR